MLETRLIRTGLAGHKPNRRAWSKTLNSWMGRIAEPVIIWQRFTFVSAISEKTDQSRQLTQGYYTAINTSSICLHNRDVNNHTSLPHTSTSQAKEGWRWGCYVMTTFRLAPWLNIAKPLWLQLNCTSLANSRLVSFPCPGPFSDHVGVLWSCCRGTARLWFCTGGLN